MKYLAVFSALAFAACAASLDGHDFADIGNDAAKISECQARGRDCKADGGAGPDCYKVYEDCMKDAGLK